MCFEGQSDQYRPIFLFQGSSLLSDMDTAEMQPMHSGRLEKGEQLPAANLEGLHQLVGGCTGTGFDLSSFD